VTYKAKKVNVTDLLQALIAMAAIPSKWENMIPIIANGYEPEDLDLNTIQDMIVTQYKNEMNQGAHKGKEQANKLLAVKHKCDNPRFTKQGSQQQTQPTPGPLNQQQHR
jgi:hypothetical protein